MKLKLTYLILAIITLTGWGCSHKCCAPEPQNVMFALKNNVEWGAGVSLSKVNSRIDTISVNGHVGEETINIRLKKVNNVYTLLDAGYYTTVGQDAVVSRYVLDTTQPNTLTLTTDNGQHLEAIFSLYFTITYSNPAGAYPAAVSFKNGNFRVSWQ